MDTMGGQDAFHTFFLPLSAAGDPVHDMPPFFHILPFWASMASHWFSSSPWLILLSLR